MNEDNFSKNIEQKAKRMIKAKKNAERNDVWFGLGMMGLIGWSVVIPTLLGAFAGVWIDTQKKSPSSAYSWTLMLLLIGLLVGCLNAWHWVKAEQKEMQEDQEGEID